VRLFNLRITREGIYMSSKTVYLSGTEIVLTSPFIREEVNALKKTVPQAKWDRIHEVWRIPLIHRDAVIEYARLWDYEVESVVEKITLPKNVVPVSEVTLDDKGVVVSFPYDAVKEGELKKIPGFKWDSQTYKWHGPTSALPALLGFAERFDIDVSDLAHDEARRVSAAASLSVKSSAAIESSLRVDGLGLDLYPYQAAGVEYIVEKRKVFVADEMGLGKSCTISTMILTPSGWTAHKDIKVGDQVIGSDGTPTEVLGVFPQGITRVLRVTFSDGTYADVSPEHLWDVQDANARKNGGPWKTLSTEDMMNGGQKENGRYKFDAHYLKANGDPKWHIPIVKPVQLNAQETPLDPYLVGCLLGDGSLTHHSVQITTADEWMADHFAAKGYEINKLSGEYQYGFSGLLPHTRELGMQGKRAHDKSIPEQYKLNTEQVRLETLQGLMDTDGYVAKDGTTQLTTVSRQLADDVKWLVQSLGGVARETSRYPTYTHNGEKRTGRLAYTLTINIPVNPFKLPRKADNWAPRSKYKPTRTIVSIEERDPEETLCIKVAAEDHLYVIDHCIVTHNTLQAIASIEFDGAYPALVVGSSFFDVGLGVED
jgi:hypothetical protein